MRIISGTARGREISAPKGYETRPVTDIIRESLFNIWQFDVEGCRFLDLFAGSGCMGLEAISRGAAHAVMVDAGADQVKTIRANLKKTKLEGPAAEVVKDDVFKAIERFSRIHREFDIVYLDPPFTQPEMFAPLMEALGKTPLLAPGATLAIRTEKRMDMPEEAGLLTKVREKKYGISKVHFYALASELEPAEADEPAEVDESVGAQPGGAEA